MTDKNSADAAEPVAVPAAKAPKAAAPAPKAAEVTEFPVSLDDACMAISRGFRKPTLLSAFAHDEEANGHLSDTLSAYRARLDLFRRAPAA